LSTQANNYVSVQDINSAFNQKSNSVSKYFNKNSEQSEVIIVFVEPSLSSEQIPLLAHSFESNPNGGSLSNIKKYVESSKSSLIFPYVSSPSVGSDLTQYLSSSLKGTTYIVDGASMTIDELKEKINGNWEILSNGITDLIVVYFNSPALLSMIDESSIHSDYSNDDSSIKEIISAFGKKDIKYTAIFTANHAGSAFDVIQSYTKSNGHEMRSFGAINRQTNDVLYTTNWPIGIVEAIFVMAPFIAILFVGICCTMQIQSTLKFDGERTVLRKQ